MGKYKIEIEIDVDFQSIFDKIPEGLFLKDGRGLDDTYELECIHDVIRNAYTHQLSKSLRNMSGEHDKYHKHHDECKVEVSRQMVDNLKVTKINKKVDNTERGAIELSSGDIRDIIYKHLSESCEIEEVKFYEVDNRDHRWPKTLTMPESEITPPTAIDITAKIITNQKKYE